MAGQGQATIDQITGLRQALQILTDDAAALRLAFETHVGQVKNDLKDLDDNTATRHNDLASRHNTLSTTSEAIAKIVNDQVSPIVDSWPTAKSVIESVEGVAKNADETAIFAKGIQQ